MPLLKHDRNQRAKWQSSRSTKAQSCLAYLLVCRTQIGSLFNFIGTLLTHPIFSALCLCHSVPEYYDPINLSSYMDMRNYGEL